MSARDAVARAARGSASIGSILVAALLPKCPMCVAAMLSAVGVGATVGSSVAPVVRPLAIVFAVLAVVFVARAEWSRRRQPRACCDTKRVAP